MIALRPIDLGEFVERRLSWIGITEDRIVWLFGIKAGGCGCSGRKRVLTSWGFKVQRKAIMLVGGHSRLPASARLEFAWGKMRRMARKWSSGLLTR